MFVYITLFRLRPGRGMNTYRQIYTHTLLFSALFKKKTQRKKKKKQRKRIKTKNAANTRKTTKTSK